MPVRSFPLEIYVSRAILSTLYVYITLRGRISHAHARATSQYVNTLTKIFIVQATIRVNN